MHVNDDKPVHILTAVQKFMHCVEVLCLKLYLDYVRFSWVFFVALKDKLKGYVLNLT